MTPVSTILNYVADAPKSAALYAKLLGSQPVESSENFAMFILPNGTALGLWARHDVEPKATLPGGTELGSTTLPPRERHSNYPQWAASITE